MTLWEFATLKPYAGGRVEAEGDTPEEAYAELVKKDPNKAWETRGLSNNKRKLIEEEGFLILGNSPQDPYYRRKW